MKRELRHAWTILKSKRFRRNALLFTALYLGGTVLGMGMTAVGIHEATIPDSVQIYL